MTRAMVGITFWELTLTGERTVGVGSRCLAGEGSGSRLCSGVLVEVLATAVGEFGEGLAALSAAGTAEGGEAGIPGLLVPSALVADASTLDASLRQFFAFPGVVGGGGAFVESSVAAQDCAEQSDRLVRVVGDAVPGSEPVGDESVEIPWLPAVSGGAGQQFRPRLG